MKPIMVKKPKIVKYDPYVFANHVDDRMSEEPIRHESLHHLKQNLMGIKRDCITNKQDAVFIITGAEGAGKSTLGQKMAYILDPEFDLESQMVYTIRDEKSYLDYLEIYKRVPYKAVVFDEAVTSLFSRDHNKKDAKDAVKIFNMNRKLQHFSILIAPSFWGLDIDLRERRSRAMLYVFRDAETGQRKYAWYSRKKLPEISASNYARLAFASAPKFMNTVIPNYIEAFPRMTSQEEREYMKFKDENFDVFLKSLRNNNKKAKNKSKGGKK